MIMSAFLRRIDGLGWVFLAVVLAAALLVPVLHLVMPPDSPLHIPIHAVSLWGKYLAYALLAISLDLVWGYCGILSLGHGAFFALGGYGPKLNMIQSILKLL